MNELSSTKDPKFHNLVNFYEGIPYYTTINLKFEIMNTLEIAQKYAIEFTLEGKTRCTYEEVFEACELSCEDTKSELINETEKWLKNFLKGICTEEHLNIIIENYKNYLNGEFEI